MNTTLNQANTNLPIAVSNAITDIITVQDNLATVRTFLSDTLDDLFERYYDPDKKDSDTFALMWHSLQHHKPYISAVMDYVDSVSDILECTYGNLKDTHKRLHELGALFVGGSDNE